jgi:hypothetical protein
MPCLVSLRTIRITPVSFDTGRVPSAARGTRWRQCAFGTEVVRLTNGRSTIAWDVFKLVKTLTQTTLNEWPGVSFGIAAEAEKTQADYGFVGLRTVEIASWHLDGMLDEAALLGPWAEAQALPDATDAS